MLKKLGIGITVFVALLIAVGFALPRNVSVARSIEINAPADSIFALVHAPKAWKRWSVWNQRDPNMALTYSGPESGVGANWDWKSEKEGNGAMTFTTSEPGKRLGYELRFEGMPPSTGALTLEPNGSGTKVTWSMEGDMGGSPINRWFGVFIDRMVGPDFEGGLANLKQAAEKKG
jgi:uncharacterized protein YndB with AHSA1/START domain